MRARAAAHALICAFLIALALASAPASAQEPLRTADEAYAAAYSAYELGAYGQARRLAIIAAEAGSVRAETLAAHLLERGLGGPVDEEAALVLYRSAGANGDVDALRALGLMARDGRAGLSPETAVQFLNDSMTLGDEEARVDLAMMHLNGAFGAPDPGRARALLEPAAAEGSIPAQRALGLMLIADPLATPEDAARAALFLTAAADAGDVEAAYALGVNYSTGDVLPADDVKAATYLRMAAEAGDAAAAADYGLHVYQGRGVEASFEEAAQWFRRAAEGGDQEGRYLFALATARGEGVSRDFEEAYYWALKSAELGQSTALNYEIERLRLIEGLEQALPEEARERVRARIEADR